MSIHTLFANPGLRPTITLRITTSIKFTHVRSAITGTYPELVEEVETVRELLTDDCEATRQAMEALLDGDFLGKKDASDDKSNSAKSGFSRSQTRWTVPDIEPAPNPLSDSWQSNAFGMSPSDPSNVMTPVEGQRKLTT